MNNQFSENLKKIRKEHNLSQEQLAEELGVSRQAISKWESASAYPEMDKIITLCDKFNCNIDDLLHKDIKEVKGEEESKKIISNYLNEFLKYITNTINMFSRMTFGSKIKCLLEQLIIALLLWLASGILIRVLSSIMNSILVIAPSKIYSFISNLYHSILIAIFFFASIIVMGHIFKKRYLDYFIEKEEPKNKIENSKEEKDEKKVEKSPIQEKVKEEKIIIRDPKDHEYKLVSIIGKCLILFIKFILLCISLSVCCTIVGLFVAFVLSFLVFKTGTFFLGLLSIILSSATISIIFLLLILNFVFNRKNNKKTVIYSFILSVIIFGIGCGLVTYGSLDFEVVENTGEMVKVETREHDMRDDLVIYSHDYINVNYVEQDIDNIKIEYTINKFCDIEERMSDDGRKIFLNNYCHNPMKMMKEYLRLLNDKKIVSWEEPIVQQTIYANHDNIEKLKNNYNLMIQEEESMNNRIDELEKTIDELEDENERLQEENEDLKTEKFE